MKFSCRFAYVLISLVLTNHLYLYMNLIKYIVWRCWISKLNTNTLFIHDHKCPYENKQNMIIPPEIQENWFHIWNNTPGTLGISWATEIHWAIRLKILQEILYQKYWLKNYVWIISYSSCVIIPIWCIKHCIIHTVLFTSNGNISLHVSNLWGN